MWQYAVTSCNYGIMSIRNLARPGSAGKLEIGLMNNAEELARKLGIQANSLAVAIGASRDFLSKLREVLPDGASLATELKAGVKANIILVWLAGNENLYQVFQRLRRSIVPDGAIWAAIPKKTTRQKVADGATFDQVQAAALKVDLVDNKTATFSDTEYGIRFVIRRERRGA